MDRVVVNFLSHLRVELRLEPAMEPSGFREIAVATQPGTCSKMPQLWSVPQTCIEHLLWARFWELKALGG